MEMVELIKGKYMKLQTWRVCGNYLIYSFVRIIGMLWVLRRIEEQLEEMTFKKSCIMFLEFGLGDKMYLRLEKL